MTKEPLEQWISAHFSKTLGDLMQTMHAKPLREFLAVFNSDNCCQQHCSHCFMVESKLDVAKRTREQVLALFGTNSAAVSVRETYFYVQDTLSSLTEVISILSDFPQSYLEIDPTVFLSRPSLAHTLRELGVERVAYSIHGDYPEHRALTGQNQQRWIRLIEGFRAAVRLGLAVEVSSCVYAGNEDRVEALAEAVDSIGGVDTWMVNRVVPAGRAREWPLERFVHSEHCGRAVQKLARCFRAMRNVRCIEFDVTWGPNYYGYQAKGLLGCREELERGVYNCHTASDVVRGIRNFWASGFTGHVYPCVYAIGVEDLRIGQFRNGAIYLDPERANCYLPERRLGKLIGLCSPDACGFAPICVGCRSVAHAFASRMFPGRPIPSNVGMDFCLTQYIRDSHEDAATMADLSSIVFFPPIRTGET
ncbi:MAG: radical SAM protein [Acidobacteriota bacterium]|jgi:MoaA/NifB/PqqE/SkfB family radical SAM enzyme